ncbi:hypothetical protein TNCV_2235201 [Trichonephila clavipes]|nr:hypothetical protein TNCV_2235201 [Trichonephila clavipes]
MYVLGRQNRQLYNEQRKLELKQSKIKCREEDDLGDDTSNPSYKVLVHTRKKTEYNSKPGETSLFWPRGPKRDGLGEGVNDLVQPRFPPKDEKSRMFVTNPNVPFIQVHSPENVPKEVITSNPFQRLYDRNEYQYATQQGDAEVTNVLAPTFPQHCTLPRAFAVVPEEFDLKSRGLGQNYF